MIKNKKQCFYLQKIDETGDDKTHVSRSHLETPDLLNDIQRIEQLFEVMRSLDSSKKFHLEWGDFKIIVEPAKVSNQVHTIFLKVLRKLSSL